MARPPGFYAPLEEALRQVKADQLDKDIDHTTEPEPVKENSTAEPGHPPVDVRPPDYYAPLEEAQHQVEADQLDKGTGRAGATETTFEQGPERPEGHAFDDRPGWTDSPRMEHQERSALKWAKFIDEHLNGPAADRSDEELDHVPQPAAEERDQQEHDREDDRGEQDLEPDIDQGIDRSLGGDGRGD
jgi:hypothetical protein